MYVHVVLLSALVNYLKKMFCHAWCWSLVILSSFMHSANDYAKIKLLIIMQKHMYTRKKTNPPHYSGTVLTIAICRIEWMQKHSCVTAIGGWIRDQWGAKILKTSRIACNNLWFGEDPTLNPLNLIPRRHPIAWDPSDLDPPQPAPTTIKL